MTKTRYRVHFTHKIAAAACRCGHDKYGHHNLHPRDGSTHGHGPCSGYRCECLEYEAGERDDSERALPDGVRDERDERKVAKILREARVLGRGERLSSVRREGDNLLCFPIASIWHCITVSPWVDRTDGRDVAVREERHGILRVRWTREGRCYVTSTVNGGLLGAYVDGIWDDVRSAHAFEMIRIAPGHVESNKSGQ